jgi:hypothetical protein
MTPNIVITLKEDSQNSNSPKKTDTKVVNAHNDNEKNRDKTPKIQRIPINPILKNQSDRY